MAPQTNQNQLDAIILYLEENLWLAKGQKSFQNVEARDGWAQVAEKLNPLGPPCRDGSEWSKIWRDLKYSIRQKLIKQKAEITKTGGGKPRQVSFSPIEQSVIGLLNLDKAVSGVENAKSFDAPVSTSDAPVLSDFELPKDMDVDELEQAEAVPPIRPNRQQTPKRTFNVLLESQISLQKEMKENISSNFQYLNRGIKDITHYMSKSAKITEKQYELQQKMFEESKKHNKEVLEIRKLELEAKIKLMQLEERKLDLQSQK